MPITVYSSNKVTSTNQQQEYTSTMPSRSYTANSTRMSAPLPESFTNEKEAANDADEQPKCNHGGKKPVFIAVMGVTGVGKSTFIRSLTGANVRVGRGLRSCTSKVQEFTFAHGNNCIHLVDTPGFDDTDLKDAEVLERLADYLADSYESGTKLSAIIYIHRINQPRMTGNMVRNLRVFRKLCGPDPLSRVILATSFWDCVESLEIGEWREAELQSDKHFWKPMIAHGSRMVRIEQPGDHDASLRIIKPYLDTQPIILQIQKELVDQDKPLIETEAGSALNDEIDNLRRQHKVDLEKIRRELKEAMNSNGPDAEMEIEMLVKEEEQTEFKLQQIEAEQKRLEKKARRKAGWKKAGRIAARLSFGLAVTALTGGIIAPTFAGV